MIKRPLLKLQVILFLLLVLAFFLLPGSWVKVLLQLQGNVLSSFWLYQLWIWRFLVLTRISSQTKDEPTKGTDLVTARVKVCVNELTHIANRKQHLVREVVHAWQHTTERLVTSSLPQCAETNKQTRKSWTRQQIVADEAFLGRKIKSSMVHSWQTGTRRLWLDPFHHVQRQKKQTQKSWTNQKSLPTKPSILGKGKKSSMVHTYMANCKTEAVTWSLSPCAVTKETNTIELDKATNS